MSRDLVAGPMCRYFATDAAEAAHRAAGVRQWMSDVSDSLDGKLRSRLEWAEDPAAEVRRFDLGPRGLAALRLLAVHAERTDLELPDTVSDPLGSDRAFREAQATGFARSKFGHLLAADAWLPVDFDFTFKVPRPDGEEASFGSLPALRDQLHFLAQRTFGASPESLAGLADGPDPFLSAAARALSVMHDAVRAALAARQPLLVLGSIAS